MATSGKPFDYDGEWIAKKPTLVNQPVRLSEIDYDGNQKSGADLEKARHSQRRWDAWSKANARMKAAAPTVSKAKKKTPVSILQEPRVPAVPTKTDTGYDVPRQMGIKEYGQKIGELHTILDSHLKSLQSLKLRPVAEAEVDLASTHRDDATSALQRANTARRGVVVGGKRFSGDAEAGRHFDSALGHLRKLHDVLSGDTLTTLASIHNLTTELPTQHLENLESASSSTRVVKPGAPMSSIPFGATGTINPQTINVRAAEKVMGKQTAAVKKIKLAQRGTARQDKFRVLTGQEEQSLGGLPGVNVRTPGRNGAVNTPINPKRRASGTRGIGTSVPKANMSRYQTPKFEGAVEPEAPKPTNPKKGDK